MAESNTNSKKKKHFFLDTATDKRSSRASSAVKQVVPTHLDVHLPNSFTRGGWSCYIPKFLKVHIQRFHRLFKKSPLLCFIALRLDYEIKLKKMKVNMLA